MPVISLEIGELTPEQKKQLIRELTASASKITCIPEQAFTVVIHELNNQNIGIGGIDIGELKRRSAEGNSK
ncbi:MAG: 4-oxalocrotonate tautomerase DmpI [Solirubrobacterales bacterium]